MSPDRFDLSSFGLAPRFPATRIGSIEEFQVFLKDQRETLDARYGYEQGLGTRAPMLVQQGTCAPCLRPATFTTLTAHGEKTADGRTVPNWREGMRCDCADGLINRQRALLHFCQVIGLPAWAHVLVLGPGEGLIDSVARQVRQVTHRPRFAASPSPPMGEGRGEGGGAGPFPHASLSLNLPDQSCQLAISQDYLHLVPPLPAALAEICRTLVPGGSFVFTVPFYLTEARTVPMQPGAVYGTGGVMMESQVGAHALAWDVLDRVLDAGFGNAAAYCYWSEELGYLGAFNLVFRASI
jgi:hypothetical protein